MLLASFTLKKKCGGGGLFCNVPLNGQPFSLKKPVVLLAAFILEEERSENGKMGGREEQWTAT